ncbi:hypothetical protein [Cognataquiflexum rubidum]|uniref:hypothetical protein n=1 Tax=Cognataquiflexum rubidum TaxID=2922273 RepID=UPI001F13FC19|nr:hypothetical protein [Cognataquiflexum rubidum]MCH6233948.1 hypothetical protein [Cognataquiflexum rubidum]
MIIKIHQKSERNYVAFFPSILKQTLVLFFFLLSTQNFAQQETKPRSLGIHGGINSSLLDDALGPSFSFHYAIRTDKVLQIESMLFFDSNSGESFMSGSSQKSSGIGLAAGLRINVLPNRNWNPSLVIMPGIMQSSERINGRELSEVSGAICLGLSNTFQGKHMVTLGINQGENISAAYIKYGFWF